jgi:HYDIN/CFA65/VesB family protein
MADEPRRGSSLPGVLTGIAAIITAVATLLGVLVANGLCRGSAASERASLETAASIQSFPSVEVGHGSMASIVSLTNRGKGATRVTTTLEGDTNDFTVGVNTCRNVSLPTNMTCQVDLSFGPQSQGRKVVTLRFISDKNADPPLPLAFEGIGVGVASITFDPRSVSFSLLSSLAGKPPPTTATQVLKITNTGSGNLRIQSIRSNDFGAHFSIAADCNGKVLGPGQSCQVTVTFSATTNGRFDTFAMVTDSLPSSPDSVALSGYRGPLIITLPSPLPRV